MAHSVKYAFTITLQPKMFKFDTQQQYDETKNIIVHKIKCLSSTFDIIAELTKNHNIHYHGIITFPLHKYKNNINKWYNHMRNDTVIGYTNIKQITEEEVWKEYISKDIHQTKEVIDRRPIIRNKLKTFNDQQMADYGTTFV